MINTKKRRTLKWFGAAPLATISFASMGSGTSGLPEVPSHKPTSSTHRERMLEIQIIDGGHVAENTVLIHNAGNDETVISQFTAGMVIFNNRMLDLNTLVADRSLVIGPNQTTSYRAPIWSVLASPAKQYVYADHAVTALDDDTEVVHLGVYLFNDTAVVYAKSPMKTFS